MCPVFLPQMCPVYTLLTSLGSPYLTYWLKKINKLKELFDTGYIYIYIYHFCYINAKDKILVPHSLQDLVVISISILIGVYHLNSIVI